ncbi:MAG: YesN2 [Symbiobacteriaceae bacterium]|jgi:two-component system response regulator YesN|nr:YesN2 [Symbiobacteriaceae bacterium]
MRILVADDEPIERTALKVIVQRYVPGAEVVGEACTGRQAVELAETLRPDVILMDINMPGMTGLEALREIRDRSPAVRCLIVSAYDHFHFAQEALRLGAVDYLLKPVKQNQMVDVLGRLVNEIHQERQRRQDELKRKEQFRQLLPLAEEELASLLASGQSTTRTTDLLDMLKLRFDAGLCMVAGLGANSVASGLAGADRTATIRDAKAQLGEVARSLCTCAVGHWQEDHVTIMIELDVADDEYQVRVWSMELARRLRDRMKELTGVRFRIGIGEPYSGREYLARSHAEAMAAFRFEGVSDKVIHFGDLGDQEAAEPEAGEDNTGAAAGVWQPTPGIIRTVEQGKRYIAQHLSEELTLEKVAREVALTPYYFGKIFSRLTGQTVMDYLTRARIDQAKQLLANPEISIKEACFAVGYSDPNYFSRVFKKVTGQTPSEYRTATTP